MPRPGNLWFIRLDDTPLGMIDLAFTPQGLCSLEIKNSGDDFPVLIPGLIHGATEQPPPPRIRDMVNDALEEFYRFFAGLVTTFADIPLDLQGTPFQLQVWGELRQIPWGATVSYQELARRLGKPKAARAVGQACGRNPIPLIIPCHRVVAGDGSLGGYSGGLARKRWLLEHERVVI